jgi:tetratricopeptide (TPR) repeat protein
MSAHLSVEQSLMKAKSHSKKGDLAEAQKLYETILQNFSNNIRAQQGLASLKKYKQNNVIQNPPQESVSELVNLYNQGQMEAVIEQAEALTAQYPGAYVVWNVLGASREEIGMFDESIYAYKKSILLKSDFADAHFNMGVALKNHGNFDEALEAFNKAISIKPSYAEAYCNKGGTLYDLGKYEEATESYNKAISLKPDYADAYFNMGLALHYQEKFQLAIQAYNKTLSLKPGFAEAHYNLSFTLLKSGRLKEGLDESEWRWKTEKYFSSNRHFSRPMWDRSQSLKDRRILLWCEQGIGDTLNWSSCLSLLASQANHCILECQDKLVPLLQRSFPNVEVKPEDRSLDKNRDDFDYHLPMGSLYRHFLSDITQNTKPKAYLVPDPDRVNYWRDRLASLGKGPYVGIGWKSTDMSPGRLPNYAPILEWSPVLKIPDVTFINLQYKDFEDDLAKVKEELGVTVHNFDDLDQFNNVDDTTALCAALDMLVSNHGTAPLISGGVGTLTKLANWKQSSWNTILNNPVGPSIDIFERNTWEPWDNIFNLIKADVFKQINN